MEINLGKSVIDTEIKALCLLRDNLTKSFSEAINILHKTSGKIILSGTLGGPSVLGPHTESRS